MSFRGAARKALPWLIVLGVAVGGWYLWSRRGAGEATEKYRTEKAARGPISETVAATGTLSAVTTVQVGSQVSGIVARLHADFNSRVSRGQLLAELDPTPFQATLDQRRADVARAEVEMRAAEITYQRQKRLVEQGLSPQADFDVAAADFDARKAMVDQSRASLRQAETNLTYTRILSPIDGVVVDRQYDVGQTVAASFQAPTLFTIAQDLTKMQVQADVDQADIGKIEVGQKAHFTVDAYPETTFPGAISQIRLNATVNQNVITYPVILTVDNPEEKLRPQMTANVTIVVSREHDVLYVPNAALRFRPVETGHENGRGGPPTANAAAGTAAGAGGGSRAGARTASGAPANGARPPADRERALANLGRGGPRGPGAASEALAAATEVPEGTRRQTIYVLGPGGEPRPVSVRTGITDGRHTAIVEGELEVGDDVIVGLATSRVQTTGSFPGGPQAPRGGGGGGGGRRF